MATMTTMKMMMMRDEESRKHATFLCTCVRARIIGVDNDDESIERCNVRETLNAVLDAAAAKWLT